MRIRITTELIQDSTVALLMGYPNQPVFNTVAIVVAGYLSIFGKTDYPFEHAYPGHPLKTSSVTFIVFSSH
ncbi:MAG: hypothetical protein J2P37_22460 [Ktedonobacteraceae bacterium]|nr:hypothetical protein [Ktedonobacteraceae bacterium]MBO0795139.1 hypothetical protein [Ktedonobacteraceae bacterium]